MLTRTAIGVQLRKDWGPTLIGKAIAPPFPKAGKGMDLVQAALLGAPRLDPKEPVPVPVLDSLEKLVAFFNPR
jgi:hypothetical protein